MIVEHSVARHRAQRQLAVSVLEDVQALIAERDDLLAEVNQWRTASSGLPLREVECHGKHLQELLAVKNEVFGAFPNGFGDNAPEEVSGDEQANVNEDETPPARMPAGSESNMLPQELLLHHDY